MRLSTHIGKWILLALFFVLTGSDLQAQKRKRTRKQMDSTAWLQKFSTITRHYQQIPLYMLAEMRNSSNFITEPTDTLSVQAEFFLMPDRSYINFGEMEQLTNDSMVLLVNHRSKTMIFYPQATDNLNQMKSMMGMMFTDSSLRELVRLYTVSGIETPDKKGRIELKSRELITGTGFLKSHIDLEYDPVSGLPLKVVTLNRTVVPLSRLQYNQIGQNGQLTANLIKPNDSIQFFIREKQSEYIYKTIERNNQKNVPVQMEDRILLIPGQKPQPAPAYSGYRLYVRN